MKWLAFGVAPAAAGWTAFLVAADAHAIDALLAASRCGADGHRAGALLLGHCPACWTAGAAAWALALTAAAVAWPLLGRRAAATR